MNDAENLKRISELNSFYQKLRNYQRRQQKRENETFTKAQDRSLNTLRLELQREYGRLSDVISKYGGVGYVNVPNRSTGEIIKWERFRYILRSLDMNSIHFEALNSSIGLVNIAIGKLKSDIERDIRDEQGNVIRESSERPIESPLQIFDAMQLHQKVIKASRALFENGHYAQAIFEAFKAVENFVKDKSGLTTFGKNLMATAFNEENPIIRVPEAGHFDKDVQEGFKFLFMGATQGIRNPKAHKEIVQNDPFITLEYLGFASFLLKRINYWEADIS